MADQNLNVNLTVDSTQLVQGVSQAASGVEKVGNSADNASDSLASMEQTAVSGAVNITRAEKSIAVAINQIQQAAEKKGFLTRIGDASIKFNAITSAAQKLSAPLGKAIGQLQEIGEKAQSLGTSAEYFQKLEKASEQSGEKFEDVRSVFEKINETAKQALSGDADAAKKLENIGIAVDDLRGKSPQKIFETVAGALAAAGDEAIHSEAALAVCGDKLLEIGDNLGDLANADVKIADGDIIPDDAVRASMELKDNLSEFGKQLLLLAANLGVFDAIGWAAKQMQELSNETKKLIDDWKRLKAAMKSEESGEVVDTGKEHNENLTWYKKAGRWAVDASLFPITGAVKHFTGLSIGQHLMGYEKEGSSYRTGAVTQEELDAKRRELHEKNGRELERHWERERQTERTTAAIAASQSSSDVTPLQSSNGNPREAERLQREAEREAERKRREEARAELQRQREEARAAMQRQRELERLRREEERARQRDIQTAERPARKRKRKSREVGESAQLSTAGSISDPKAARAQRRHELRLAREAAKQKITVKVRPVKGAVIRNAVSTAVGGSLKQLAAAVERLSLQTYIVK